MEHPARAVWHPKEKVSPFIWKLPQVLSLLSLPQIKLHSVCQRDFGQDAQKPTYLLAVNLPSLDHWLNLERVPNHLIPQARSTFGKDEAGAFRSIRLKEYPPPLCRAFAGSFAQDLGILPPDLPRPEIWGPPTDIQCVQGVCTTLQKLWAPPNWTRHFGPDSGAAAEQGPKRARHNKPMRTDDNTSTSQLIIWKQHGSTGNPPAPHSIQTSIVHLGPAAEVPYWK